MPNKCFFGETGAGKTTAAVEKEMIPHFRDGGIVVTTVALKRDRWVQEFGEEAVEQRLIELPQVLNEGTPEARFSFGAWDDLENYLERRDEKGRGPMFVIDEAHKPFPQGMRFPVDKETGQRKMEAFPNRLELLFTDQRHYLINLILITQNPFRLAAPLVAQMHSSMYLENAEEKGGKGAYTAKIWSGPPPRNYKTVKFADCNDAISRPTKYNSATWEFFTSNTKASSAAAGRELEGKYRQSRSIWSRPFIKFGVPALILFLIWSVSNVFDTVNPEAKKVDQAAKAAPAPSAAGAPPPSRAADHKPEQVIADLAAVEQSATLTDTRKQEAHYATYLYVSAGVLAGRTGPVVATQYPNYPKPHYALLSDYAAFWGYSIEPAHCGWLLSRSDNTRQLVDPTCLSREMYNASSASAPSTPAANEGPRGQLGSSSGPLPASSPSIGGRPLV